MDLIIQCINQCILIFINHSYIEGAYHHMDQLINVFINHSYTNTMDPL
jgi:hypothetical protein